LRVEPLRSLTTRRNAVPGANPWAPVIQKACSF
jgi:hypothetical protein